MKVVNILRDGTVVQDLSGIVIQRADFPMVYKVIENMNKRNLIKNEKKEDKNEKSIEINETNELVF